MYDSISVLNWVDSHVNKDITKVMAIVMCVVALCVLHSNR
jgi:hypothetical protein